LKKKKGDELLINFQIPKIEIRLRLLLLLIGRYNVDKITFFNSAGIVSINKEPAKFTSLEKDIKEQEKIKTLQKIINYLDFNKSIQTLIGERKIKIELINNKFDLKYNTNKFLFRGVRGSYLYSKNKKDFRFFSNINGSNTKVEYKEKFNRGKTSGNILFNINSTNLKVKSAYNVDEYFEDVFLKGFGSGYINIDVNNLNALLSNFLPKSNFLKQKIIFNNKLNIKSEILNFGRFFKLSNITINSKPLSGSGDINYALNKDSTEKSTINFDFLEFNIDDFFSKSGNVGKVFWLQEELLKQRKGVLSEGELKVIAKKGLFYIPFFHKQNFDIKLKIRKIIFNESNIKTLDSNIFTTKNGGILINQFSFILPDGGNVKFKGAGKYNVETPQIAGKLSIEGQSLRDNLKVFGFNLNGNVENKEKYLNTFKIDSNVVIENGGYYLENLTFKVDENLFNGRSVFLFNKNASGFYLDLNTDVLTLDNYYKYDVNKFLDYGVVKEKMLALNNFNLDKQILFNAKKLSYNNRVFDDFKIDAKYGEGYLKIDNFSGILNEQNIDGSFLADVNKIPNPILKLSLQAKNLETKKYVEPKATKYDYEKIVFGFPSMEGINGDIEIELDSIAVSLLEMENLKFKGNIKNGEFNCKTCEAKIFDGNATIEGKLGVSKIKGADITFVLTNFENYEILKFLNINNIKGKSIATGFVNGLGYDKKALLSNIDIQAKFRSSDVKIEGFGLTDMMEKTQSIIYSGNVIPTELNDLNAVLYNKQSITDLENIDGTIAMKKDNTFDFKFEIKSGVNIGGKGSGNLNWKDGLLFTLNQNLIFNAGTTANRIPLAIIIIGGGNLKENQISFKNNFDQVEEYLTAIRNINK
jgi:uncharacterized membrane protein (Fun14 family)